MRLLHYSIRTESAYVDWITRFLRFHRTSDGNWKARHCEGCWGYCIYLARFEERSMSTTGIPLQIDRTLGPSGLE